MESQPARRELNQPARRDREKPTRPFEKRGLAAFLRAAHPAKTASAVAARTGQPAKSVERWLAGQATPNAASFVVLVAAYGPALLAACVPGLAWVERAVASAEHDAFTRELKRLEVQIAATSALMRRGERP